MLYLISYDMEDGTSEEYEEVRERLLRLGAKKVLLSQWASNSPLTAPELWQQIEDLFLFDTILKREIGDRLLIAAIDLTPTRTASRNLITELNAL